MTLRHIVLFGFTPESTAGDIERIESAFAALPSQIAEVASCEWGTDISPEGLAQGHTHCFSLEFADAKARDAYLVHPAHTAFTTLAKPHLAKVLVIDYEARGAGL